MAERKNATTITARDVKSKATGLLGTLLSFADYLDICTPEYIERYSSWSVTVMYKDFVVGTLMYDTDLEFISETSTTVEIMTKRFEHIKSQNIVVEDTRKLVNEYVHRKSPLTENMLIQGDCIEKLQILPEQSIDLIFTSPPYYNARKQYAEYITYEDYLEFMRRVIKECSRVLMNGKYFVINTAPVIVPRAERQDISHRLAIPFDLHTIFMQEGYEFVDDIVWEKPEGAGWSTGRGRGFLKNRNPMTYKAVPVTEYLMVYRKKPCIPIECFLKHTEKEILEISKVQGDYEATNIWKLAPAYDIRHPAVFPIKLAENIIKYYSFVGDYVLDPFSGTGTTLKAALEQDRHFCGIEKNVEYMGYIRNDLDLYYALFPYTFVG